MELLCSIALEEVVVGKGLESGSLPDRQASALKWIRVDEIVSVLRYMAGYRRPRVAPDLYAESVGEVSALPVLVIGRQAFKAELRVALWRDAPHLGKRGCVSIPSKILGHVASRFMVENYLQTGVFQLPNQRFVLLP